MSLILEALKKLEREKHVPQRGFHVVAATPWPSSARRSTPTVVFALIGAMAIGGGAMYWLLRPSSAPAAPSTAPAVGSPALPEVITATTTPRQAAETLASLPAAAEVASAATSRPTPDPTPSAVATRMPTPPAIARATTPAAATPPATPLFSAPFTLEAISSRDGAPIAIINGRLLREGDVTDGVTVVKIGTESVEIEVRGVRQVIRF
jgi:hypothetical protein